MVKGTLLVADAVVLCPPVFPQAFMRSLVDSLLTDVCLHLRVSLSMRDCLAMLKTGQKCQEGGLNWLVNEGWVLWIKHQLPRPSELIL